MADRSPRRPADKNRKRSSSQRGKAPKIRKKTVRNSAAERSQRRRPHIPTPERQDDEDMLSEFSDDTNNFYVDEQKERRQRTQIESREKKQHSKKEKRKPLSPLQRRLIRILSYGAIITVILIIGIVLSLTVLFKTEVYEVTGCTKYSESEIVEAGGIGKGQNIFLAPKRSAEKRIKEKFPYVEEVRVSSKIPDTIKINVEEAVEGYMIKMSDTEYLVVSTKGRILDKTDNKNLNKLPIFVGPKPVTGEIGDYVSYEDETLVDMVDSITQTFADNGYQGITEIDATNMADISFTYDNRIKIKLGIPEDLNYKIRTAMTIIDENLDKNGSNTSTGVLDVSRCNSTRRSYFKEGDLNPTQAPTQDPSQDPSQPATQAVGVNGAAPGTDGAVSGTGGEAEIDLGYDYYDEDGYGHYW